MRNSSELTNSQMATYATYLLGGASNPVDMEDIAIKLFELAPQRFCWKKYPDHIDIHVVRVSLSDAARISTPLLEGSIRIGYMLTKDGLLQIKDLENFINDKGSDAHRRLSVEASLEKELIRLQETKAYKKFLRGEPNEIKPRDFQEFTRVNDYFPSSLKIKRYTKIENASLKDEKLIELWEYLKERFIQGE